ncbi:MAG TPA: hypothetical protein VFX86_01740 [Candidatus Saccharimonadales bacterium]|nr:hypothetical protein [Candidatus Saccharimonadales bacterium]
MSGDTTFCERIGRVCEARRVCLIASRDWAEAADRAERSNGSVLANIGRFASRVLPFMTEIGSAPVDEPKRKKEQYDQLLAKQCEGDSCVAEEALLFN